MMGPWWSGCVERRKAESHRNSGTVCRWALHKAKSHNCARNLGCRSLRTQGSSRMWPSSVSMVTQFPHLYNTPISPNCTPHLFPKQRSFSCNFCWLKFSDPSWSPMATLAPSFQHLLLKLTEPSLHIFLSNSEGKSDWHLLVPPVIVYKELSILGYSVTLVREGYR